MIDIQGAIGIGLLIALAFAVWAARRGPSGRTQRRRGGVGSAAMGSVYDLLNEDKRRAIEIIVEEKAEERRPEYPDGNLPDLDDPAGTKKRAG
jgi:hypothetical protein